MTTIADIQGTIDAMSKEFGLPYELEHGGSGISWKLTLRPMGSDILRAPTKAQLLRDMQNYREGMREGLRTAIAMISGENARAVNEDGKHEPYATFDEQHGGSDDPWEEAMGGCED